MKPQEIVEGVFIVGGPEITDSHHCGVEKNL
jgi:hypothetical protein